MNELSNKTAEELSFDVFIQGELVDLVVLTEEVVMKTNWYKWFNDEAFTAQMQQHYFPNTRKQQMDFFRNQIENSLTKLQCGIVHKGDNLLIGMVSLSNINHFHRKCEIGGFIGEKRYHKLKYFVEALQLILKHAFDQLNMHRIYGGTIIKEVADMFVKILAFKLEGVGRGDVYKNGKYNDVHLIGLLREEYYGRRTSK